MRLEGGLSGTARFLSFCLRHLAQPCRLVVGALGRGELAPGAAVVVVTDVVAAAGMAEIAVVIVDEAETVAEMIAVVIVDAAENPVRMGSREQTTPWPSSW